MKKILYKYYKKCQRLKFLRSQERKCTSVSANSSGYMYVKCEGENGVPEGCSFYGNVFLGFRTTLGKNNLIVGQVSVGKYCQFGMNVAIHSINRPISNLTTYINPRLFEGLLSQKTEKEIIIGNDVWIGHAAIILGGVHIGNGAIIAAGSVVTKNVEPYSIVAGNPARFVRKRFPETIIKEIEALEWWDKNDNDLDKIKPLFFKDFSKVTSIYE